eukprot:808897-Prorocentrum_minimum.AAC.1
MADGGSYFVLRVLLCQRRQGRAQYPGLVYIRLHLFVFVQSPVCLYTFTQIRDHRHFRLRGGAARPRRGPGTARGAEVVAGVRLQPEGVPAKGGVCPHLDHLRQV